MSEIIVRKSVIADGNKKKKILQACEIGGSIYGRTLDRGRSQGKKISDSGGDLMAHYKNFYREQLNIMNKVFEKNGKQG